MVRLFSRSMMLCAALMFAVGALMIATPSVQAGEPAGACGCETGKCNSCSKGCGHRCGKHGCSKGCQTCRPYESYQPNLFGNYYAPQTPCGGQPVQMYLSPVPTPASVGHTYYTYQALMPHESMYPHRTTYRRSYDDGRGTNRTRVHWKSSPIHSAGASFAEHFRFAR